MGYLNKKLTNERYTGKKRKHNESSIIDCGSMSANESFDGADDVTELQRIDVEDLKLKIFSDSNMCEIEGKLKSTFSYRSKMLENKSLDLLETFPYFFTDPKLVKKSR